MAAAAAIAGHLVDVREFTTRGKSRNPDQNAASLLGEGQGRA
jgi:hypothetical protein